MIRIVLLSFSILLGCQSVPTGNGTTMGIFEFHNSIWINLHHQLYNEALKKTTDPQSISALNAEEQRIFLDAIQSYRANYAGRDLLFDHELQKINAALSRLENQDSVSDANIPKNLIDTLNKVSPIYKKYFWPLQEHTNAIWIASARGFLATYGDEIQSKLEKLLKRDFSESPYRVDVSYEANWAGAYTTESPPYTVVSSTKNPPDVSILEVLFHEAMHAGPFSAVQKQLDQEFALAHAKDNSQLWHAMHFFTVGNVVQTVLHEHKIEYTPYAIRNGLYARGNWNRLHHLLKEDWQPYLEGKSDMASAIHAVVGAAIQLAKSKVFGELAGCMIVADIETGQTFFKEDAGLCNQRIYTCSTFKIPLAVMAFDSGVLKDTTTKLKWDKKPQPIQAWEADQNAKTWLAESVVWFSQRLTPQLGLKKIQEYLQEFEYGNEDFSGGITKAWLSSSLKISAEEQVLFLRRLHQHEFPAQAKAMDTVLAILPVEVNRPGLRIVGKTGSGDTRDDPNRANKDSFRVGWYVGYFESGSKKYAFATVFKDKTAKGELVYSGGEAKKMTVRVLQGLPKDSQN